MCKCRQKAIRSNTINKIPRDEWEIVENCHEAIVSREQWDRVQKLIDRRPTIMQGNSCPFYNLFHGLVYCATCGKSMEVRYEKVGGRRLTAAPRRSGNRLTREDSIMATTRIMPLHIGKGRTESQAVSDIIDYVSNPQKTDNGRLVTGFACDSRVADAEFLLAKREYISTTGRVRGADDVLAYHVRQSFVPGEITPEEANRLGVEFAKRFTKGNHAFVVCTHIDKSHIHNHIIWNAVNVNCDRKFRNFWGSTRAVRRLNDTICVENGYSIVEDPKPHGKSYNKWLGDQAKPSHREQLRMMIDQALEQKPADFDRLLKLLAEMGCEVSRRGQAIRLKVPGWKNVARMDEKLGQGYSEDEIRAVLAGKKSIRQERNRLFKQSRPTVCGKHTA